MKKTIQILFLFLLSFQSRNFGQPKLSDNLITNLSKIIKKECTEKEIPAFSIVLVDSNGILFESHFGNKTANNSNDPVDINTIYRTGSVGKTITDLAILIAVEHEKLDLDIDVRHYLPDFDPENPFRKPVTLRQLIKHTSGLVREPPAGNYFDDSSPSLEATVKSLNETTLLWEPGSKTKYSNAGLAVVGRVLENVYGKAYELIIDSLVFRPLSMTSSRVGYDPSIETKLATGYMWFPGQKQWQAPVFDLGMKPAGDFYISIKDMASLMSSLLSKGKRLISEELFEEMWKPSRTSTNWQMDVGLGFSLLGNFNGEFKMARHGGAVYGYSTELAILPQENLGVYSVATQDMCEVARLVAHWLLKAVLNERKGEGLPEYNYSEKPFSDLPSTINQYDIPDRNTDTTLTMYIGNYGPAFNPLKIYAHQGDLYALIEWFFLYKLSKNDNGSFSFPSWSFYGYEKIRFVFGENKKMKEAIIGNGKDGVHFNKWK